MKTPTTTDYMEYKPLISTLIIKVLAVCIIVIGIVLPVVLVNVTVVFKIGFIIGCLPVSAILFLIANIADDIHYQSSLKQYSVEESVYYHTQSIQLLTSIEGLLQQQFYPQPVSYTPRSPSIPSHETSQPDMTTQDIQPNEPVQYHKANENTKQHELQEDDEPKYRAQFMRPVKTPFKKEKT